MRYRAVEHHQFSLFNKEYLFDVESLTVLRSEALDSIILAKARSESDGAERKGLLEAGVASGHALEAVEARLQALIGERFLLAEGDEPDCARKCAPSSHITFMVNVSQRCNLTCSYCYVNKGHFDYAETAAPKMRSETAAVLVDRLHREFAGFDTYAYHFYGGEPLLNFSAVERIVASAEDKARATGTRTDYYITTNGTRCTPYVADFFDTHRFTVYYSIDGDEVTHDQERRYRNGKGSYRDVEANLAHLRTRPGVHLIGSSVVHKGVSLREAIDKLRAHGVRQCKAERVRLSEGQPLALVGEAQHLYLEDIRSLVDHYVDALAAYEKPLDFRLSSKILQLLTRVRRDFFCPAGERMFGISAEGEIYPCALHVGRQQSLLGHVEFGIDSQARKNFRKRFSPDGQEACQTCWTRRLCGGGCSAMVDRFGHEDCRTLRSESEAAIAVYQHFVERDPTHLYGLVSPKVAKWMRGLLEEPDALWPSEPHAERMGDSEPVALGGVPRDTRRTLPVLQ